MHSPESQSPDHLPHSDEFAFFAIAGQISVDLVDEMYKGVEHITEDDRHAWETVFAGAIQYILSVNPEIVSLYSKDKKAALLMVKNDLKKMHPENA